MLDPTLTNREVTAYAFGNGEIGFKFRDGTGLPDGALFLAAGPHARIVGVVRGMARRAYDGETLLVPGVPEAPDATQAYRAFIHFFERLQVQLGPDSNM